MPNPYRTNDGTNRFGRKPVAPSSVEEHMAKIRAALHNQQLTLDEEMDLIADLRTVLPDRRVIGTYDPNGPFSTLGTGKGYLK